MSSDDRSRDSSLLARYVAEERSRLPSPPLSDAASLQALQRRIAERSSRIGSGCVDQGSAFAAGRSQRRLGVHGLLSRQKTMPLGKWSLRWAVTGTLQLDAAYRVRCDVESIRGLSGATAEVHVWRKGGIVIGAVATLIAVFAIGMRRQATFVRSSSRTYTTTAGQRTTIVLHDSTRVDLAPGSQISISERFGAHDRMIALTGEALFDVRASSRSPFVVRCAGVSTRVLGTRFAIRHYANDVTVDVSVIEGRVVSTSARARRMLATGMHAQLSDSTTRDVSSLDSLAYTDWAHGRLVFKYTPVPVMLATVGRWYGYNFQLADTALRARVVSAVFNISASQETMMAIRELLSVTMTIQGNVVTLQPQRQGTTGMERSRHQKEWSSSTEVGR